MIVRKYYSLSLLMILTLITCSPRDVGPDSSPEDYDCKPPPPDVFTTVGVDLEFIQLSFGKVMMGDINIETDPQVIALATKAVTDDRIRNYLRCLAIHRDKYTNDQAAYFDLKSDFMVTNPTTKQLLEWQNNNPYPKDRSNNDINTPHIQSSNHLPSLKLLSHAVNKTAEGYEMTVYFETTSQIPLGRVEFKVSIIGQTASKILSIKPSVPISLSVFSSVHNDGKKAQIGYVLMGDPNPGFKVTLSVPSKINISGNYGIKQFELNVH